MKKRNVYGHIKNKQRKYKRTFKIKEEREQ